MHGWPGEAWTLQSLARACRTSRTSFAGCFAVLVGTTPMAHLTAVRMNEAAEQLIADTPVGHVAGNVVFRTGPSAARSCSAMEPPQALWNHPTSLRKKSSQRIASDA